MCFTIHSKHRKAKIAKKNISCYKTLTGKLSSMYHEHYYILNKICPIVHIIHIFGRIDFGYHSYSNKSWVKRNTSPVFLQIFPLFKCIIPKGTRYFYNPDEKEYVSETIIVQEKILLSKRKSNN